MNTDLEKAFALANLMATVANQKRALKEEYEQSLFFFHNGGIFKASKELISFLHTLLDYSTSNTSVVVDNNGMPVEILDLKKFFCDIMDCYISASNQYLASYQTIKRNRAIEGLLQ
jgi:hypothetical protein